MSRGGLATLASMALLLWGCGVELGVGGGAQLRAPHGIISTSHFAVSTKLSPTMSSPLNLDGILVGAEVGSRSEHDVGSRWLFGTRLGYGRSPNPQRGAVGWEAHLDVGTPLRGGGLLPDWSFYAGGGGAAVIWLSDSHQAADLNASLWVVKRVLELVPYANARVHVDNPCEVSAQTRYDIGLGAALRLRFVSDLF